MSVEFEKFHLTYTDFARSDADCMPLGNGALACNVAMFTPGYIEFPVSHDAAWDEHHRLLKLCKVRIAPKSGISGENWRQTLIPEQGVVVLEGNTRAGNALKGRVWVDRFQDSLHVELELDEPVGVTKIFWRDHERRSDDPLASKEIFGHNYFSEMPVLPDVELPNDNGICWYHHNAISPFRDNLKMQHLEEAAERLGIVDPLLNRIFGGILAAAGDDTLYHRNTLMSHGPRHHIYLVALVSHPSNPDAWLSEVRSKRVAIVQQNREERFTKHATWWREKLASNHLCVSGPAEAERINLAYFYQRYMMLAASGGNYPLKFNGSLFTGDPHASGDALGISTDVERCSFDYRRWGGFYWFQNTRLAYWALLGSGDTEILPEFFEFYISNLDLARERSKIYFDHDGVFFPETMTLWGTYLGDNYGLPEERAGMKPGDPVVNEWVRFHFNNTLEMVFMMLCYDDVVQDNAYFQDKILPFAIEVLTWWEQHWPRDENGMLCIGPAHAMETYWEVTNPSCDLAGLHACLGTLLERKANRIPADILARWKKLRAIVPPLQVSDDHRLLPCDDPIPETSNYENPELYAIFPFRLHGLGAGDAELARKSFEARLFKERFGWQQNGSFAALTGNTEEAKADVLDRIEMRHRDSWFPAFWAHNYDWAPCQDQGANLMLTLQFMARQKWGDCQIEKPAIPEGWEIEFE